MCMAGTIATTTGDVFAKCAKVWAFSKISGYL